MTYDKENIVIDGKKVRVFNEKNPEDIPWGSMGVDYVCESTGIFLDEKGASKHLTGKSPAKKVCQGYISRAKQFKRAGC